MAANSPEPSHPFQNGGVERKRRPGFIENAMKNKTSYIQLFFMTGVMLLSMRSLGQKYRIGDLEEDISSIRKEKESLSLRMESIKKGLLHEASLDPTGLFASKLRSLFGDGGGNSN